MQRNFALQKRVIHVVLGLLLAADLGLAIYSWQLASAPRTPQQEFDAQNMRLKVLKGDIKSAQDIKDNLPATLRDCDKFEQALPPVSTGYSSITAELDDVANKAGLQIVTRTYKQKDIPARGMAEVLLDATVDGDYG
ncbi:MAG: hypothetical protein WBE13_19815, partial [Candidatus Acidiferrum sp.]